RDPPEVIWAHYRQRLASKTALMRLLSGRVKFRAIAPAIAAALAPTRPGKNTLVQEYLRGIGEFTGIVRILLAERDRTAQAFLGKWNRKDPRIRICAGASHSFVEPNAQEWLAREVLGVLAESQELPFTPPPAPGAA
ncbi:MAG: hypothetical protein JF593_08865, partial [Novosphingobium sp.]|nr:hypothetical protein [Novosphingobium sp.]